MRTASACSRTGRLDVAFESVAFWSFTFSRPQRWSTINYGQRSYVIFPQSYPYVIMQHLDISQESKGHHADFWNCGNFRSLGHFPGNQSTRHTVKSCDELTVVSDGVVTSRSYFLTEHSSHSRASPSSVTLTLHAWNPNNQTELHGIAYVLLYARLP